ncbi:MAG TPA: amidohydrolase family protein [Polyangiaceae bacterium]|nr:amidohydrolase family protein [Polyangiaceae bacterium]
MAIIDLHFHALATNDHADCNLSKRAQFGGAAGWLAGALLGTLDEEILDILYPQGPAALTSSTIWLRLAREIRESTQVDGVVVLALDQIVDSDGAPRSSDICVSNTAAAEMIANADVGSKKLYLGASVHPNRLDAIARLEHAKSELNAVLVKWVPSSQRIDPDSALYDDYYRKLAQLGLPLLCHSGPESAIPDCASDERLNDPRRLRRALDAGVTVIVAHGAAHFMPKLLQGKGEGDYSAVLRDMLLEADTRGWRLYTDISAALISPYRAKRIGELLAAVPSRRFVYGSDFPIFTHDLSLGELGRGIDAPLARQAFKTNNLLDKDVFSKRSVGIPDAVFENSARVLGLSPDTEPRSTIGMEVFAHNW